MSELKPQEARVLKVLLEHDYFLNTTQVARKAKMSWNTADKYLHDFYEKGWIDRKERGAREYWRAYR